jgi:hypothetical protein
MAHALATAQRELLLRLPHDVLVNLFVRLEPPTLGRLAATCRLLQYGQRSLQSPNLVEAPSGCRSGCAAGAGRRQWTRAWRSSV